jgi:hypothetical protein
LDDERLPVGVVPRTVLELEAMAAGGCELLVALEDAMDEDEVEGRAFAGGVSEGRESMAVVGGGAWAGTRQARDISCTFTRCRGEEAASTFLAALRAQAGTQSDMHKS